MGRGDETFRASRPGAVPPLARLFLLSDSPSVKPCFLRLWLCLRCPLGLGKDLGKMIQAGKRCWIVPAWPDALGSVCIRRGRLRLPCPSDIARILACGVNEDACAPSYLPQGVAELCSVIRDFAPLSRGGTTGWAGLGWLLPSR